MKQITHQNDLDRTDIRNLAYDAIRQMKKKRSSNPVTFVSIGATQGNLNIHNPKKGIVVIPYKTAQKLINWSVKPKYIY